MKNYVYILFLIQFFSNTSLFSQNIDSITNRISFENIKVELKINREDEFMKFADSIQKISTIEDIPNFIYDECLEFDIHFSSFDSTESFRWKILENVTEISALDLILSLNDVRLNKKCDLYMQDAFAMKIEYIDKTFYELVEKRYLELIGK